MPPMKTTMCKTLTKCIRVIGRSSPINFCRARPTCKNTKPGTSSVPQVSYFLKFLRRTVGHGIGAAGTSRGACKAAAAFATA
eukprot:1620593-Amphidinium_carterae.1